MQLVNINPFSQYDIGDLVEVPDGAAFDDFHWALAAPPEMPEVPAGADPGPGPESGSGAPAPASAPAPAPQFPQSDPKEM